MRLSHLVGREFKDETVDLPARQEYYDHCNKSGNNDIKQMLQDYAAAYENAKEFTVR